MLEISSINSFNQKGKIYAHKNIPFTSSQNTQSPKNTINIIPNSYADELLGAVLVAGVTALSIRNGKTMSKLANQLSDMGNKNQDLSAKFDSASKKLEEQAKKANEVLNDAIEKSRREMEEMEKRLRGEMAASNQDLRNDVSGQMAQINAKIYSSNIPEETVEINGKNYNLATVFNPLKHGEAVENEFKKVIQAASTERILGIGKVNEIPENGFIRIVSFEAKPFNMVGGLATVPKEIAEEMPKLSAKTKNARVVIDTPLYTGRTNMKDYWRVVQMSDGSYSYQKIVAGKMEESYKLNLVDEFNVPIVGENPQHVRLFQTQLTTKPIEFAEDMQKQFDSEFLAQIQEAIRTTGKFENDSFVISKGKDGKTLYQTKVTYNLWDNEKFALDIPLDRTPNNYSDDALKSGLLDRAVFFNKYIYEHTYNMANGLDGSKLYDKSGKAVLGADAFILNDWHTGPLAAMMRLNSSARHFQQGKPENVTNKLANMRIISLLHNTYDGQTWDSGQISRMLNVMFDENAAKIVPNAHMPNTYKVDNKGLPMELGNACMVGDGFSCLNMLAQYSDSIHPVSEGFGKECMSFDKVGNANNALKTIFALRSKENLTPTMIKRIAGIADISLPEGLSDAQLAKPTFYGIDNGLNKLNNILTQEGANAVEKQNSLIGEVTAYSEKITQEAQKALEWKMNNKRAVIGYFVDSVSQASGRTKSGAMNVWFGDSTDLSGVTVDTPIFTTAGRYTEQKGLETYIGAIEKLGKEIGKEQGKDADFPVFIIQGAVNDADEYTRGILDLVTKAKENLTKAGYKKAADRIVVLDRGEGANYMITKLLTDATVMASEYEPCGLTQKEFMNASGALCVGHDTGGICSGLTKGVNIIGVDFKQELPFAEKVSNLTNGFKDMLLIIKDKDKYGECIKDTLQKDFTWTVEGGSAEKYVDALFS